jgi:alpha,alpha-trehalase
MRESGFDTSFRFGPFSGSTGNDAPVCLNSLLFKYERDMADFARILGKDGESAEWTRRAEARRAAIDKYLWDPASGMYLDYDFTTGERSNYPFLTMYYPLWAGAASPAQAAAVEKKLSQFEESGGLQTSDYQSGVQWDAPFGWAPITWLAVAGLDRNGFHEDAVRISNKFRATILENFERDGTIREKYNVVSGSANVQVAAGYKSNVVGFGWTNAVYRMMGDVVRASK